MSGGDLRLVYTTISYGAARGGCPYDLVLIEEHLIYRGDGSNQCMSWLENRSLLAEQLIDYRSLMPDFHWLSHRCRRDSQSSGTWHPHSMSRH